ncbi:MAG: nucleoside triphosphate pyrophosphohydrolase [Velocimicrobium sp.]
MKNYTLDEFVEIIRKLRAPDGCPWDKEQTHDTLKEAMIEEAYEVVESINNKDILNLREELGDVLLQVVMHSIIAEEKKEFLLEDVISDVAEKMIRRHPHVFGDVIADNTECVLQNWEEIKKEEHKESTVAEGMLRVAKALPATIRAQKVQKIAGKVGFDFPDYEEAVSKVYEELEELSEARKIGKICEIEEEYGDLMFSVVNLSRFLQLNTENSLTNATNKFINRFEGVERLASSKHQALSDLTIDEMNDLWKRIK